MRILSFSLNHRSVCCPILVSLGMMPTFSAADAGAIEEVKVVGERQGLKTEPSAQTEKLLKTAGTFGDPIQSLFSLPGVVQVAEEDPDPAVRGSSPDANLFLVDDLPVSYLFHGFGTSIFNENLIQDFGLKSAGFGASYGEATGAVFDVRLRDPRQQPLEATLDLSLIRAGAMLEGAVTENQAFYFSARAGLIQHFIDDSELEEEEDIRITNLPNTSDYQGKYQWRLANDNVLTFNVSGARESAAAEFGKRSEEALLDPGQEGAANISEQFNSQSLSWRTLNSDIVIGRIVHEEESRVGNGEFFEFEEESLILKGKHNWQMGEHQLVAGLNLEQSKYDYQLKLRLERCSDFSPECEFDRREVIEDKRKQNVNTYAAFIEDQWEFSPKLRLTYGVHASTDDYLKEANFDPRASLKWQATPDTSVSGSIGRYHQLPEEEEMFPRVGNPKLTAIAATHYVLGVDHKMQDGGWFDSNWSWNASLYYKQIDDLVVDTDDETAPFLNRGNGTAYGLEFMLNRARTDRWFGWFALSLSETKRTNELSGQTFPFSYDTPVVANIVLNYQMNKKWNAGLRWTYRTGALYTPIIGNRENPQFPDSYVPIYGEINSQRLDDFHRLDFRFERSIEGRLNGSFYIDILNVYGRENASGIDYLPQVGSRNFSLEKSEGFPLFPSIGIQLKF